jgi:hypothetical protein
LIVAGVASTLPVAAADNKTTAKANWERGIQAYKDKDYTTAVEAFQNVVEHDHASADVYYNLGNAYFKLGEQNVAGNGRKFANGELGRAVLNYERALKLNPGMDDAEYNLDHAKEFTNDTEAVPEGLLVRLWHGLASLLSTNMWAALSLLMLFACIVLILTFLLHHSKIVRMTSFFVSLVTALMFVLTTLLSLTQLTTYTDNQRAVIIALDSTPVHASPDSGSKIIRQPSQGVTVTIERSHDNWAEVRFADGEKGWIRSSNIEII